MLDRLKVDPKGKKDYRAELDGKLRVRDWLRPGQKELVEPSGNPRAPHWWRGDEDATQSFLMGMGVKL